MTEAEWELFHKELGYSVDHGSEEGMREKQRVLNKRYQTGAYEARPRT